MAELPIQLVVRVSYDQRRRLLALAKRDGVNVSEVVRQALEAHVAASEASTPASAPKRPRR